jgi:predicted naringenin-chalcone synthase
MIIDIATASPPYRVPQAKATEELKKRMGVRPAVARLIDAASHHSGIESRYIVVPDADDAAAAKFYSTNGTYVSPDTKRRIAEYEKWAKLLTRDAVGELLRATGCDPQKIGRLIVISCTGFFAPGLDYHLLQEFSLPRSVKRTTIGFMGCAASIVGFSSVLEAMTAAGKDPLTTLMVSVEICSLHLQTEPTRDNILANMIFADGAAAVLISNDASLTPAARLELVKTHSLIFDNSSALMGWKIGNEGFEMSLSSELPKIILEHAVPALKKMLADSGISPGDIKHWALHPGGRAILDALQEGLQLSEAMMLPSRTVLKNYGNMSSASILFVLKELLRSTSVKKNDLCCAVAFGPGLSMEMALLKGA